MYALCVSVLKCLLTSWQTVLSVTEIMLLGLVFCLKGLFPLLEFVLFKP